jgi:hypothetical protein
VRKVTRRALVAGAGVLVLLSGVDGADVMGQARAEEPPCGPDVTEPCQQQVDQQQADLPSPAPPPRHKVWLSCSPAALGAHCTQRWLP